MRTCADGIPTERTLYCCGASDVFGSASRRTCADGAEYAINRMRSNSGFCRRKVSVSVIARCAASSGGNMETPVLIAGNAIDRHSWLRASDNAER